MKTKAHYLKRAEQLKKQIDGGKLKGKQLERSKKLFYSLRHRAKYAGDVTKAARRAVQSRRVPKVRAADKVDAKQGFLPTFLKQMNIVRIEEMVADRLFREVAAQLGLEIKKAVGQ